MSNKRKYLFVTPFFPSPNSWRGAYVLDQVKAIMRNSDYDVVVFRPGVCNDNYEIEGVKVFTYKNYSLPSNILNGIFNRYNSHQFVKRVQDVGINPMEVSFVHCHVSMSAACGLELKKLNRNIRVLLQHHDLDPFNLRSGVLFRDNRFNIRYRAKKAISLYNEVDLHICISDACRNCLTLFPNPRKVEVYEDCIRSLKLCEGLPSIKPKDTYVLYNGVDCSVFNTKTDGMVRTDVFFRIGCVANFNELKDHITLIKAFEIFIKNHTIPANKIKLSLLGTGELRAMCEGYIREHGLDEYVEWPNEVAHNKLSEYYHSLNLFVLPSYFEGFGCVYAEAAACGVPYMGCTGQGYSEYIEDKESGRWLISPRDYERLAELIEDYYNNRYIQHYQYPFDINLLIKDFLKKIENL